MNESDFYFPDNFYELTKPDYFIFDCNYVGHKCTNQPRRNLTYWKPAISLAGHCISKYIREFLLRYFLK